MNFQLSWSKRLLGHKIKIFTDFLLYFRLWIWWKNSLAIFQISSHWYIQLNIFINFFLCLIFFMSNIIRWHIRTNTSIVILWQITKKYFRYQIPSDKLISWLKKCFNILPWTIKKLCPRIIKQTIHLTLNLWHNFSFRLYAVISCLIILSYDYFFILIAYSISRKYILAAILLHL